VWKFSWTTLYSNRQNLTSTQFNTVMAMADKILGHIEGEELQQQQQQPLPATAADIVAASVAAAERIFMAQGQAQGAASQQKKIDYALRPKIL
jgi:hypothetical protein